MAEQVIRPGQLNLMTAGHGVSHSEEGDGYQGMVHGVQLWVAQPEETRHGSAGFEHHPELPILPLGGGAQATVLVGAIGDAVSPARRDTDHVGADLDLPASSQPAVIPLNPTHEHALVVLSGGLAVDGSHVVPGQLAYLGEGRGELAVLADGPCRALLLGGIPFPEPIMMWWNYVARSHAEIIEAHQNWTDGSPRFGTVDSVLDRIPGGQPPWSS